MGFPYRRVFKQVEESLIEYGSRRLPPDQIRVALDVYKTFAERELRDELCFSILRDVVFYTGIRAATVTGRMGTIYRVRHRPWNLPERPTMPRMWAQGILPLVSNHVL